MFAENKMEGKYIFGRKSIKRLIWTDSPNTAEELMVSSPP